MIFDHFLLFDVLPLFLPTSILNHHMYIFRQLGMTKTFFVYLILFSNLYIRNLKYAHSTPVFRLQNSHLEFSTCPHKLNWVLCTKNMVLNASFQDF